jgi:drug/metabolite transporter (DMT)-like permease
MIMIGNILALLCALSWSIAVICFKSTDDHSHPFTINLFKNMVGLVLASLTWVLLLGFTPDLLPLNLDAKDWATLILSGILGIGIADAMALTALQWVGAARFALIECIYAPAVILGSVVFLGDRLSPWQSIGVTIVLASVLFMHADAKNKTDDRGPGAEPGIDQKRPMWFGAVIGSFAIILMVVGILMVKPIFAKMHLLTMVTIRLAAGVVASYMVYFFFARINSPLRRVLQTQKKSTLWLGAIFGTYLSMILWLAGFKYQQASITAVLNQTSTIFIALMAAFLLKESIGLKQWIIIAAAFFGVLLVSVS